MTKRFTIAYYVQLIAAVIFSFFCLSFNADISLLAFPLAIIYTALSIYFIYFRLIRLKDGKFWLSCWKLSEYLPFVLLFSFVIRRAGKNGTPYWYDVITVILWCIVFVASLFIIYYMNAKRVTKVFKGWKNVPDPKKKPKGLKRIGFEILDWVDAIVGAIFDVLLIQIFILQLYVIPSESMVPQFLIKDRVAVSKINCGPKFPLTEIGLPDWGNYQRGDIVVLRNPHYSLNRKSEVKTVVSQLIYMLTFMQVNLNTDENGNPKADPLVKRVTGIPGEQLVMQDGTLYARTSKDDQFKPVEKDYKYAAWNLNALPGKIKRQIETMPFTQEEYEIMLNLEEKRREMDLTLCQVQANELADRFSKLVCDIQKNNFDDISLLEDNLVHKNIELMEAKVNEEFMKRDYGSNWFRDFKTSWFISITAILMTSENGSQWFTDFMTSWFDSKNTPKDMYEEANYRLNIMTKLCFGNIVVRYAELAKTAVPIEQWRKDEVLIQYFAEAETLLTYVQDLLDERNMCVFPANDSNGNPVYIPENCFFMMGDNRFNSLDLRHSDEAKVKNLTSYDPKSVSYYSRMEPQYINKKYIIGKPVYRFWPAGRIGRITSK